ncbi:hypothetical protein T440DRAFT_161639 [Plenodomus tracheiphilus IPT5]|uniref:Extracellular membrane protein CFEM domain-containing protein n=1 Tax=Plenodomus tracheiphilus IPT5 TaxID=1408161 RepID=A0A6A7BK12_9PLEO|nr:hypothetical protein T440DRAFT_161639 [Plenodomus tracheiphilus IPT5]
MINFASYLAIFFIGLYSPTTAATITTQNTACPCYTATAFQPGLFCPPFTKSCAVPKCLVASTTTTTLPAPSKHCPKTSTLIEMLDCQTACKTGCGTVTVTATATTAEVCTPTPVSTGGITPLAI